MLLTDHVLTHDDNNNYVYERRLFISFSASQTITIYRTFSASQTITIYRTYRYNIIVLNQREDWSGFGNLQMFLKFKNIF